MKFLRLLSILILWNSPVMGIAQNSIVSGGGDSQALSGSMSHTLGQQFDNSAIAIQGYSQEGVQQIQNSACIDIDSILPKNSKGGYVVYFNPSSTGNPLIIQWKGESESNWRSKSVRFPSSGQQSINVVPNFNIKLGVRITPLGQSTFSDCVTTLEVPCKSMLIQTVEQTSAFCEGDSALVRVGIAGGYGAKEILWSNGATTKRTYAQQGEKLYVTVTDASNCSITDSITASTINTSTSPSNLFVARNAAILTASWNPPSLTASQSVLFYRVNYRLRGTTSWTSTTTVTDTFSVLNWNGSGIAAGNYEFMVVARIDEDGNKFTSEPSCRFVRGYNGIGGKTEPTANVVAAEEGIVAVYPNPTEEDVFVRAPIGSAVELMDVQGKEILKTRTTTEENKFNLTHLPNGVYLVRIECSATFYVERIVKR